MVQSNPVKEFHRLLKNVKKMSNRQAVVSEWDDDDVTTFKLQVKPSEGLYRGGTFMFKVTLPIDFPRDPPEVWCETMVYHPNIDPTEEESGEADTNVCLNMFNRGEWRESYGVDGLIQGILFLFQDPNVEDPLSPFFDSESVENFEENVRKSLKGESIDGNDFPYNFEGEDDDELLVNNEPKGDNSDDRVADVTKVKEEGVVSDQQTTQVIEVPEENTKVTEEPETEVVTENTSNTTGCGETDLCNRPTQNGAEKDNEKLAEEVQNVEEVHKGETLGIVVKPKEAKSLAQNHPDVVPTAACSASCDVVSMVKRTSLPDILVRMDSQPHQTKDNGHKSAKMQSFDSVLPELGFVFAVLNSVTRRVQHHLNS